MEKPVETRVETLYEGRIVRLYRKTVRLPHGGEARLEIVHHPGAAAVVPLHADGTVTLVHQYRHAVGDWLYELPAGLLEAGEPPMACAARELEEEAGLTAAALAPLATYHTTPGFTDEVVHLFLATGLTPCAQRLEADELLTLERLPLWEALARAGGGTGDGKTLIGLMLAARHLEGNA